MTKLVFLQLNEINFDLVRRYAQKYPLAGFQELFSRFGTFETSCEQQYEQLEPWIQWVSIHTGKTFAEHKIFRLGDAANVKPSQVFGLLEQQGLRVGAVSPMNAWNDLKNPAYFIPDPWTATDCDDSSFSRRLTEMLRQTVNDNASGAISWKSIATLAECCIRTLRWPQTLRLMRLIARSRGRSWMKALVLDQLIHMVHLYLVKKRNPDVSFVFFNAGAHIQHHYMLSSEFVDSSIRNPSWYSPDDEDPILDMIQMYDHVVQDYLQMSTESVQLLIATGLTQVPYDRVKFYYRLNAHSSFLKSLGIRFAKVMPRMTRDFEIIFDDRESVQNAVKVLSGLRMKKDGVLLFSEIEDRGLSLFVTLTYPHEIEAGDLSAAESGPVLDMSAITSFVAVKNAMHSSKGYAFLSPELRINVPANGQHVAELFAVTQQALQ